MKIIPKMGMVNPLVHRPDRVRGGGNYLQFICELAEGGINIRSLTEAEADTTTLMGKAFYGIVAGFAHAVPRSCRWTPIRAPSRQTMCRLPFHR